MALGEADSAALCPLADNAVARLGPRRHVWASVYKQTRCVRVVKSGEGFNCSTLPPTMLPSSPELRVVKTRSLALKIDLLELLV